MTSQPLPITILGAGRIGTALAKALHKAGHPTTVWNRSSPRLATLGDGIRAEPDLVRAVTGASLVVIAASTYAAAGELLARDAVVDALGATPIVPFPSGTPREARELGAWAHARGIPIVDGAVMVTPDLIGTERCVVLYAGAPAAFESTAELRLALGGRALRVGDDLGAAKALDAALIANLWGGMFAAVQGAALCDAERVDLTLYRTLLTNLQPVTQRAVVGLLDHVSRRSYASTVTTSASLRVHELGVAHLIAACEDRGLHADLPRAWAAMMERTSAAGHQEDELAAIFPVIRGQNA
jgi:3-hydroxyisobutyrate dehydrogenase-like beta-hydroxyacid dehydrogenase